MAGQAHGQGAKAAQTQDSNRRRWHRAPYCHGSHAAGRHGCHWPRHNPASHRHGRRYIWSRPGSTDPRHARAAGRRPVSPRYCPSERMRPRFHCHGRARFAMAGMSCTSKVREPGLSQKTALVLGFSSGAISAAGRVVAGLRCPMRLRVRSQKVLRRFIGACPPSEDGRPRCTPRGWRAHWRSGLRAP